MCAASPPASYLFFPVCPLLLYLAPLCSVCVRHHRPPAICFSLFAHYFYIWRHCAVYVCGITARQLFVFPCLPITFIFGATVQCMCAASPPASYLFFPVCPLLLYL